MDQIREHSKNENMSLWKSAEILFKEKDTKVAKNISSFFKIISKLKSVILMKILINFLAT